MGIECLLCFSTKSIEQYVCGNCYNKKILLTAREGGFDRIKRHHVRELTLAYELVKDRKVSLYWQRWDGHKTPDICIENSKLHIEVDGSQHQSNPDQIRRDMLRTYYANKKGYLTIRVPNATFETKSGFLLVAKTIQEIARKRRKKCWQFWK